MLAETFDFKRLYALMTGSGIKGEELTERVFGKPAEDVSGKSSSKLSRKPLAGSIGTLSKLINYGLKGTSVKLTEAKKNISVYAEALSEMFLEGDESKAFGGKYKLFIEALKNENFTGKDEIAKASDLPKNPEERRQAYIKLFSAVLDEVFENSIKRSTEINAAKGRPRNGGEDKAISGADIISGIQRLDDGDVVPVFHAVMERMSANGLEPYEKEMLGGFISGYLIDNSEKRYMETFKRTDEIFIDDENSVMKKKRSTSFDLVADRAENLRYTTIVNVLYPKDLKSLDGINAEARREELADIFHKHYRSLSIYVDEKKVAEDRLLDAFTVLTKPRDYKYEQGYGCLLNVSLCLDREIQVNGGTKVNICIVSERVTSPITDYSLYLAVRIPYPVKKYVFTCGLSEETPKHWEIRLYPFLPGYFPSENSGYAGRNFFVEDRLSRTKSFSITDWVTPGFGFVYILENKSGRKI